MKKIFTYLVFLVFLGFSFIGILFWQEIYPPKAIDSGQPITFSIAKGEGSKEIALSLQEKGLIKYALVFRIYVLVTRKSEKLQAGDYLLLTSMSIPEIAEKFASGDTIKEKITLIEGWNLRDIGFYFENRGMFQAEEFWEAVGFPAADYSTVKDLPLPKDFSTDFGFLLDKPKNVGLEGYLFPDTYEIEKGATVEDIIRRQLANFDEKISKDTRREIKKQGKTIFEIINMASIIEKEAKTLEDKKLVSGVLWKRLKAGMPLQADATVSYVTAKQTTKVSIEETQIDSSYNTYKYRGLPLGPISNPGLSSIMAAVYPEDSEYWYYLSTPEGEIVFSKTLEEHNIAKAKYLK